MESKTTAKILLVLVGFGVLSWLSLTQTSKVSSARYRILNKQAEQACLQRENAELLGGIMEMVEVSDLEKLALGFGYVPAERVRYLTVPGYSPARTELRRSDGVSRGEMGVAARLRPEAQPEGLEEEAPVPKEEVGQDGILPYSVSWLWNKVISQFKDWMRE